MITLEHIGIESANLLSELSIKTFREAYKELHSQANLNAYCRDNYSPASMESLLAQNNTEVIVAFNNTEPSGFFTIKHHRCSHQPDVESTELKQIYVLSSYFGSGLGSKLFDSAVKQSKNNGSEALWLCVSDTNYRAQSFYNKLGFSRVGDGPELIVGDETLSSSILILSV